MVWSTGHFSTPNDATRREYGDFRTTKYPYYVSKHIVVTPKKGVKKGGKKKGVKKKRG